MCRHSGSQFWWRGWSAVAALSQAPVNNYAPSREHVGICDLWVMSRAAGVRKRLMMFGGCGLTSDDGRTTSHDDSRRPPLPGTGWSQIWSHNGAERDDSGQAVPVLVLRGRVSPVGRDRRLCWHGRSLASGR